MAAETATNKPGTFIGENAQTQRRMYRTKTLFIETADTADAADTVAIDLANYGGTTFLGYIGAKHTTNDSVVVTENPTTAVSGTTLTLTFPAGTDNDKRVVVIFYE